MKKSIGKKVLVLVFGPFLLILGILSAYILYTVIQNIVGWTELELKGISDINTAQLEGKINSVRITVLSAAETLNKIDEESPHARKQADETIQVMFINESVYNAWLVYEPNAFDGRDLQHTEDYPGAPSGRFMLSYVMEGGELIVAPDMDEAIIDDPAQAPWYAVPRDDGRLYIDVANNVNENLYDYGVGGEPVYTLSVVAPLFRDGQVIGCVGADVVFDTMTFGIDNAKNAAVAVFYPDGRVFFAEDIRFAEDSVDTLGFIDTARIKRVMSDGGSLFLPNEYCPFLAENAFAYFNPVHSAGMDKNSLYLYVALPRTAVLSGITPVLAPVAVITVLFLIAVCILYVYAQRKVFRPIRQLTMSADAISQGDLQTGVTIFSRSEDEIGTLSRSLQRMVEQFRIYIFHQEQVQEENVLQAVLNCSADVENSFSASAKLTAMLRDHFKANRLTLVLFHAGKAAVAALSDTADAGTEPMEPVDFIHHSQVFALLSPHRKLVFQNKRAIAKHKLSFVCEDTVSVCILPIWNDQSLSGYLIFENNDTKITFQPGTESSLLFVSRTLPDWLAKIRRHEESLWPEATKEIRRAEDIIDDKADAPGAQSDVDNLFMDAVMQIDGLYADTALDAMGGLADVYERTLRLFIRTVPETIEKMDASLQAGDMQSFAIEIHGMRGAFNNIGAMELGGMASALERAAKEGGTPEQCAEDYSELRGRLIMLLDKLSRLPEEAGISDARPPGDAGVLMETIQTVSNAVERYDSLEALDILAPLLKNSYGDETDKLMQELSELLEMFECEKAMETIQKLLGGITNEPEIE